MTSNLNLADSQFAVVGMACRLPGAGDLATYWDLVSGARCALEPLSPERFNAELYYDPHKHLLRKSYSLIGGVVPERPFDSSAYRLTDNEVAGCDPVQLTFLEVAADALRHAGFDPLDVPLRNTGVYVGNARGSLRGANLICSLHARAVLEPLCSSESFLRQPEEWRRRFLQTATDRLQTAYADGNSVVTDLAANRVARLVASTLGFTGPAEAIDAACASSLVALHQAARALQQGRIDMAVVGGASYSGWTSLVLFSQAEALSAAGSFPFDARADGFISSDGYAAIVVKSLARALADGDRIHGVIRGLGLSSDGRGKSLWAPRREGQLLAIRRGLACGADASRIQYIEAHGTSTQLGDATEVQALTEGLGPFLRGTRTVPVASVKANIGHTRETAGIAGLIKVLLAMQHRTIPPAAGFQTPNPAIPWDSIPFFVPTTAAEWSRPAPGSPRRAAVDAFGIGGLNVHLLVDDEPEIAAGTARAVVPADVAPSSPAVSAGKRMDPIAVIGRGAVFPGARTLAAFHELLQSGRDERVPVPADRWDPQLYRPLAAEAGDGTPIGGFVRGFEYDWRKHRIPPKQVANADPLQFMALDAAEQALEEAARPGREVNREQTAVVIGAGFSGDFAIQLGLALRLPEFQREIRHCLREQGLTAADAERICSEFAAAFESRFRALQDETASYSSSTLASRVAKTFDLMGGACSIDAGGGSSLAALSAAVDLLRTGDCDTVLCGGAQRALDPCVYDGYRRDGVLAKSPSAKPFDPDTTGLVPGEGCGFVLLKRLADAVRDGDRIHGVIHGLGTALQTSVSAAAVELSVQRALADGAIDAGDVMIVEASGVAVPKIDRAELDGLEASYRTADRKQSAWVDAVSCRIGYANGAAGMASFLKLLAEFDHCRAASPSTNGHSHDESSALRLRNGELFPPPGPPDSRLAGSVSCMTLKGDAYHLIAEAAPADASPPSETDPVCSHRVHRFESDSPEGLARQIESVAGLTTLPASSGGRFSPSATVRLAIVAGDDVELRQQLLLVRRGLTNPDARPVLENRGIFLRDRLAVPRVAFAFAGQGSQYAGMLEPLVRESPVARDHLQEMESILARLGLPGFEQLAWRRPEQLGRDLFATQLSVLLADVLMFRVLTSLGIRPQVITAHSFGEYPALVASGAWELEQAIEMTRLRCQAIADVGVAGAMLATSAGADETAAIIAGCGDADSLFVANVNAPSQSVVAGRHTALERLAERLQQRGFEVKRLPVPAPFHTPLMSGVGDVLRSPLSSVRFCPPSIPLLSSVTNRYVSDPDDLRANLVEQLSRPVRYTELVRRLVDDGVDLIIEIGPRDVLTGLHRQILGPGRIGLIATDDRHHPGEQQLLRVQALLECSGGQLEHAPVSATTVGVTPAPPRATAAAVHPILYFDATARRRDRNRAASQSNGHGMPSVSAGSGDEPTAPVPATDAPDDPTTALLVRLICEQTGYPPEVVDLDAELEADLGIDSIKKAQLLGELREYFPLKPAKDLSLDSFPTLRHILTFIRASQSNGAPAATAPQPETRVEAPAAAVGPATISNAGSRNGEPAPATAESERGAAVMLNLRTFSGTPREIGEQHGLAEADAIRNVLLKYVEFLGDRLLEMRPLKAALDNRETYFGAEGIEELSGIAHAVGMAEEHLFALNYGLSMEFVPGCTQFAVTAAHNNGHGLIHAVNEDWMLALALPGTLRRMAQVRFTRDRIPFLTFSTCGQLAGQNGINARGVAVSSTLLLDRLQREDRTVGRVHPTVVKHILERAESVEDAVQLVRDLPRCGAWSMCISQQATDRICYVEYDASSVEVRWSTDALASTNHCLLHQPLGETPDQSRQRLDRLRELLHDGNGSFAHVSVELAQSILRDRYDRSLGRITTHPTKSTIRRPYTQASIVMCPAAREIWVTADSVPHPDVDRFYRLQLDELFRSPPAAGATAASPTAEPALQAGEAARTESVPGRIMNRFVLRMFDEPLRDTAEEQHPLPDRVLLIGDNPTARALRQQLAESGVHVDLVPCADDPVEALAQLEVLCRPSPISTLLLVTGRDLQTGSATTTASWRARRDRGVVVPYLLCQRWVQLVTAGNRVAQPRVIAVTGLGGDFGLSGQSTAVEGGALAGLLKAIRHEFPGVTARLIDAPLNDPPQLVARCVQDELTSGASEVEVAYVCGRRRVLRPVPGMLPPLADRTMADQPTNCSHGAAAVAPHGTWIVTGGGRGITAVVARELGRRFGLKLHLIGSSPHLEIPDDWRVGPDGERVLRSRVMQQAREAGRDPLAAWKQAVRALELDAGLRAFADAGVEARYHECDLADASRLAEVLAAVRAEDGPLRGILHGAGYEEACRFEKKTTAGLNATLAAKVDGLINLAELTRDDPLDYFVGFGSISGRFGGRGQTDYSMSSDLLAKLMGRLRHERPTCRPVAIHWPVWGEIGMAMRPESKLALEIAGQQFMSPAEGVAHLIDELLAGAPEPEVLLYDWPTTHGARRSPWTPEEAQAYWNRSDVVSHSPLLDGLTNLHPDRIEAELSLRPEADPFLIEHHHDHTPVLPLVIALEALAEAAAVLEPDRTEFALRDVRVHNGMRFHAGETQFARVNLARQPDGQLHGELRADFRNRKGVIADPSRLYVSARIDHHSVHAEPSVGWIDPPAGWSFLSYDSEEVRRIQRMICHGPVFRSLEGTCTRDQLLWGRILVPRRSDLRPGTADEQWRLPASVLDGCLQACSMLFYILGGTYHLPHAAEQLRFWTSPQVGEECVVVVRMRERGATRLLFDFALYGHDRRILLDATGYRAAIVAGKALE